VVQCCPSDCSTREAPTLAMQPASLILTMGITAQRLHGSPPIASKGGGKSAACGRITRALEIDEPRPAYLSVRGARRGPCRRRGSRGGSANRRARPARDPQRQGCQAWLASTTASRMPRMALAWQQGLGSQVLVRWRVPGLAHRFPRSLPPRLLSAQISRWGLLRRAASERAERTLDPRPDLAHHQLH
jgi:hypothetical protein